MSQIYSSNNMTPLVTSTSSSIPFPPRKAPLRQDTVTWQPYFSRVAFTPELDTDSADPEAHSNTIDDVSSLDGCTENSSPNSSSFELDHEDSLLELSDQEMSESSSFSTSSDQFPTLPEIQHCDKNTVPALRKRPRRCRTLMQPSWDGQGCRYLPEYKPNDVVVMDDSSMTTLFKSAHGISPKKTPTRHNQAPTTGTYLPDVSVATVVAAELPVSQVGNNRDSSPTRLSISYHPLAVVRTMSGTRISTRNFQLQAHYFVTLENPNADTREELIGVTHSITGITQEIFPDKQYYNEWQAQSYERKNQLTFDDITMERILQTVNELLEGTHSHAEWVKLNLPNCTLCFRFV
ncbi:hypothetical protein CPB86DRAFT_817478 [Serendipita vermifera]|nr:hypothetical protein CPB86DRAFT_817478 [Serendipita vermifera]